MSGATLSNRSERSVAAPAGRSPSPVLARITAIQLKARTAASDGHTASTRAARSAGINFAVILLSKTVDVGRDHLIHRKRSPFPYEGKALTPLNLGVTFPAECDTCHVRLFCRTVGGCSPS